MDPISKVNQFLTSWTPRNLVRESSKKDKAIADAFKKAIGTTTDYEATKLLYAAKKDFSQNREVLSKINNLIRIINVPIPGDRSLDRAKPRPDLISIAAINKEAAKAKRMDPLTYISDWYNKKHLKDKNELLSEIFSKCEIDSIEGLTAILEGLRASAVKDKNFPIYSQVSKFAKKVDVDLTPVPSMDLCLFISDWNSRESKASKDELLAQAHEVIKDASDAALRTHLRTILRMAGEQGLSPLRIKIQDFIDAIS